MANDLWQTPQEIFDALDREFGFDLDVACTSENCKCPEGAKLDYGRSGLVIPWRLLAYKDDPVCWMNPPYSRGKITAFCKKAYEESLEGCTVVAILPCDCSRGWWQEYVEKAAEIRSLPRRVRFIDPETGKPGGAPTFGSVIVIWGPWQVDQKAIYWHQWDWKE